VASRHLARSAARRLAYGFCWLLRCRLSACHSGPLPVRPVISAHPSVAVGAPSKGGAVCPPIAVWRGRHDSDPRSYASTPMRYEHSSTPGTQRTCTALSGGSWAWLVKLSPPGHRRDAPGPAAGEACSSLRSHHPQANREVPAVHSPAPPPTTTTSQWAGQTVEIRAPQPRLKAELSLGLSGKTPLLMHQKPSLKGD